MFMDYIKLLIKEANENILFWKIFKRTRPVLIFCLLLIVIFTGRAYSQGVGNRGPEWKRHVIDEGLNGADGGRLLDVDADGDLDLSVGWKETGKTRIYLNPGFSNTVADPWPYIEVGNASGVEDAVMGDLDGDGRADVVSARDGGEHVTVHFAPTSGNYTDPAGWTTMSFPVAAGGPFPWMYSILMDLDEDGDLDIVAGGKNGVIRWFDAPSYNQRDLSSWSMHDLGNVGWLMSLFSHDMDGDGDLDLIMSDRKPGNTDQPGVRWLENPGPKGNQTSFWTNHYIYQPLDDSTEVMFIDLADMDHDGLFDIVVTLSNNNRLGWFHRLDASGLNWNEYQIDIPIDVGQRFKSARAGNIDNNGDLDIVLSTSVVGASSSGVIWLEPTNGVFNPSWTEHEISGPDGIKFDDSLLIDLDGDGDLDVINTEEDFGSGSKGLGVIWYENPLTDIVIHATFDSGSLESYTVAGNTINVALKKEFLENTGAEYTYWINFKASNMLNKEITFNITGVDAVPFLSHGGTQENQMVYSCDGEIWNRITQHTYSSDNSGTYTFTKTFHCNQVQIATFFPFSHKKMTEYIDRVGLSQWATVTWLGSSFQGRDIDMITITNTDILDKDKRHIFIIGRQHAAESASSHMLEGMIDFLISDIQEAKTLRDKFSWYFIPMVNPDGVYNGNSRATSTRDSNRDWGNYATKEINIARDQIELIHRASGIDLFIDWHNQMSDTRWYNFVYSPVDNTFFPILNFWTDFDQEKTPGTSCSESSCSARGITTENEIFTFVFEPTPHLSDWTLESLKEEGKKTSYAIAEYFGSYLPDTTPPFPNPVAWEYLPASTGPSSVVMTATTVFDENGVEYYFECTSGGCKDSNWQDSATYEETGLQSDSQYTYKVKARDKSANQNNTGWSSSVSVTTDVQPGDTTPPVITLVGANPQIMERGTPYIELGAIATDVTPGDLTGDLVIDASAVDTTSVGSYVVTYNVTDEAGNQAVQVLRTVNVNSVNADPVADNDTATTDEDIPVLIDVLGNDSDIDGDTLNVDSVTDPAHGSVVNNGIDVNYTPDPYFNGIDTFTYTVSDGNGGTATATVTVNVNPAGGGPVVAWTATDQNPGGNWSNSGWDNRSFRILMEGTSITISGSTVQLTLRGRSAESYTVQRVSLVQRDGNTLNGVDSTNQLVTFGESWDAGVTVPANGTVTSDPIPIDLVAGQDMFLTFWVPSGNPTVYRTGGANTSVWAIAGNDQSATIDWEGLSISDTRVYVYILEQLDVIDTGGGGPPVITTQPTNQTVTEPNPAKFTVVAAGDGPLTYQWLQNSNNIPGATSASYTLDPTAISNSGDLFDVVVTNDAGSVTSASATLTVMEETMAQLEFDTLTVGGVYVTVTLTNTYVSPVVVCSVQYNNNTIPVVPRVNNVTSNSFDVRLQNPSGGMVSAETVSYLVVEEGVWSIDGVNIEAQTYESTVTDENNNWVGETQNYGQSYTNPVWCYCYTELSRQRPG